MYSILLPVGLCIVLVAVAIITFLEYRKLYTSGILKLPYSIFLGFVAGTALGIVMLVLRNILNAGGG